MAFTTMNFLQLKSAKFQIVYKFGTVIFPMPDFEKKLLKSVNKSSKSKKKKGKKSKKFA